MSGGKGGLVLAGDVGGTKTFTGLFERSGNTLKEVRSARFANQGRSGVEEIIEEFIESGGGDEAGRIEAASFGIACPVVENRCRLTNLDWEVDGDRVRERFGLPTFRYINDLVATAWGVDLLTEDDLVELKGGRDRPGNRALLAAGTGLGQAQLFWDGSAHLISASEGGHGDFAPRNELEIGLLRFLTEEFGHVSYERVLSGPGLVNVYEFLTTRCGFDADAGINERFHAEGAASVITEEALRGGDPACVKALEVFVSIYGAEAGNIALRCLATGGVYVGGGIAPKILPALEGGGFIEAFLDKGRFTGFLEGVPVRVITNERTALVGAAGAAVHQATGDRVESVGSTPA